MQAARADLNLDHHGRCRGPALSLEQHAYQALEELTKEEQKDTNAAMKHQRLQAIQQTEGYLRTAEQDVYNSEKTDPPGNVGVDVTALDNAMHALDSGYGMGSNSEAPPSQSGSGAATAGCEAVSGATTTPEEKVTARLNAARIDLSGKYHGNCRHAALEALSMASRDLEELLAAEDKLPSFPDAVKEKQRKSALERTRQYQMSASNAVEESLKNDPQGKMGVGVTPIDNALATLKASFGG